MCVACTFILFNCVVLFVFLLPVLWVVYVICRNLIWRAIISSATTAISYCLLKENCKRFFLPFCLHFPDKHTYKHAAWCIRSRRVKGEGGGLVYLSIDFVCFLFHLPTLCGPEKPPLLLLLHVFFLYCFFPHLICERQGNRECERAREVDRGRQSYYTLRIRGVCMYWMFVIEILLQAVTNIIHLMFVISQVHTEVSVPLPLPLPHSLSTYFIGSLTTHN